MSATTAPAKPARTTAEPEAAPELTDGFHLLIDALKLNGISTIYGALRSGRMRKVFLECLA